ncbi:MAG TPA: nuclear transport factor 2 family protein [Burkholderiales bacterium]|nr:nuclear transport factor 2 family protein [Burkholderiales bacterium]
MLKRVLILAVLGMAATVARASTMEDEVRAVFDKYIATQNAHDLKGIRNLLSDSPDMLWISRGKPIWGRDAALRTLEERYKGTWKIEVDRKELRVISVSRRVAQVYAPTQLSTGEPGAEPSRNRLYINLVMVKKPEGWQIVSILPILVPPQ